MLKKLDIGTSEIEQVEAFNALVDAVNGILDYAPLEMAMKAEPEKCETPVDPFAEQRKWIGYLCWFWDDDYYLKTAGVLEEITTIEEEFHYAKQENCTVWKHCEPILPTDNAIYKGGDND